MAEEYCWVLTEGAGGEGLSRCGRSDSDVLEFGFQMASLVYTYTVEHDITRFHQVPDLRNLTNA